MQGLDYLTDYFSEYTDKYTIIGGAASYILMNDAALDFRATKDIDLVLSVEARDVAFVSRFWSFVKKAGYEHKEKSGDKQFYRFTRPKNDSFPYMIELFSRMPKDFAFHGEGIVSPLPMDDDVQSLSAILLDDIYYDFLLSRRQLVSNTMVLDVPGLIVFKARAFLDLTERKEAGERVDSKNIRKHKNDVFRLYNLLVEEPVAIPDELKIDISNFIARVRQEPPISLKPLGLEESPEFILDALKTIFLNS